MQPTPHLIHQIGQYVFLGLQDIDKQLELHDTSWIHGQLLFMKEQMKF
jgi:hypothetical protein